MADMAQAALPSQAAADDRGEQAGTVETRALPEKSGHALKMGASASMDLDSPKWLPNDANGLRGVDPQVIMQRVAEGELLRDIAKDYGVSRSAVSHYLRRNGNREEWAEVREYSIAARLEQAHVDLAGAEDNVTLGRAREIARLWMWRAEREFGHIYASRPQTAVNIAGSGQINVHLVSYSGNADSDAGNIINGELAAPEDSVE